MDEKFVWFALHTYKSQEERVREQIELQLTMAGLREKVRRIEVPVSASKDKDSKAKSPKKRDSDLKALTGYVLLEMVQDDAVVNLLSNIRGVSGFLGTGFVPMPMPEEEVAGFLALLGVGPEGAERKRVVTGFTAGDRVRVIDGLLAGSEGTISAVDNAHGKVTVNIVVFGRATPTELDASQVEKATDK